MPSDDCATGSFAVDGTQVRRVQMPAQPLVWALTGEGEAAGSPGTAHCRGAWLAVRGNPLAYGPLAGLRARLLGASRRRCSIRPAPRLPAPPWPDVLITQRPAQRVGGALDPPPIRRPHAAGPARPAGQPVRAVRPDRGHARRPAADPRQRAADRGAADRRTGSPSRAPLASGCVAALRATGDGAVPRARVSALCAERPAAGISARAASAEVARHGGSLVVAADPAPPAKLVDAFRGALPARRRCWTVTISGPPRCWPPPTASS